MRLNISDIPEDGLEQELQLSVLVSEDTGHVTSNVHYKAFRFEKKVLIEGSVKATVTLKCSRCLSLFEFPLSTEFREELNPEEPLEDAAEKELSASELEQGYYINEEIDISELVRELILLAVPMKPLCRDECLGICSVCGKVLNESSCKCRKEEIDPRLSPLVKLKMSMGSKDKNIKR